MRTMKTTLKVIATILIIVAIGFVAFASFTPAGDAKSPAGPPKIYRVHAGDTLWDIVLAHHEYDKKDPREVIWEIEKLNGMRDSVIQPGQRILLP
jgi:nucleoid-associated protein YgaU